MKEDKKSILYVLIFWTAFMLSLSLISTYIPLIGLFTGHLLLGDLCILTWALYGSILLSRKRFYLFVIPLFFLIHLSHYLFYTYSHSKKYTREAKIKVFEKQNKIESIKTSGSINPIAYSNGLSHEIEYNLERTWSYANKYHSCSKIKHLSKNHLLGRQKIKQDEKSEYRIDFEENYKTNSLTLKAKIYKKDNLISTFEKSYPTYFCPHQPPSKLKAFLSTPLQISFLANTTYYKADWGNIATDINNFLNATSKKEIGYRYEFIHTLTKKPIGTSKEIKKIQFAKEKILKIKINNKKLYIKNKKTKKTSAIKCLDKNFYSLTYLEYNQLLMLRNKSLSYFPDSMDCFKGNFFTYSDYHQFNTDTSNQYIQIRKFANNGDLLNEYTAYLYNTPKGKIFVKPGSTKIVANSLSFDFYLKQKFFRDGGTVYKWTLRQATIPNLEKQYTNSEIEAALKN